MSLETIVDKVVHFYSYVLPVARGGTKFSKEIIGSLVKEAFAVKQLLPMVVNDDKISEILQAEFNVGDTGQLLLLALADNLRVGSQSMEDLHQQFQEYFGYKDLEFSTCIEQRNKLRSNFIHCSEQLKSTQLWPLLKAYIKLIELNRLLEKNEELFKADLKSRKSQSDLVKLVPCLSLPPTPDFYQVNRYLLHHLKTHLDWPAVQKLAPTILVSAMDNWPELFPPVWRLVATALDRLAEEEEEEEGETSGLTTVEAVGGFLSQLLAAAGDGKRRRELLERLERHCYPSGTVRTNLLRYLEESLSRRTL